MDASTEKKWFLYLGEHHEGPFSLLDVRAKIAQGEVTSGTYVWAEGLPDWMLISEEPSFEQVLKTGGKTSAPLAPKGADPSVASVSPFGFATALTPSESTSSAPVTTISSASAFKRPVHDEVEVSIEEASAARTRSGRAKTWVKVLLFISVPVALLAAYQQGYLDSALQSQGIKAGVQTVSDFAQPYLLQLADKVPALGKWISPLPRLDDVTPEEYEDLKAAASPNLAKEGAKLAMALSRADLSAPQFYVASNLPDKTEVDVYVEGVSETLLNQLSFTSRTKATLAKKLGSTPTIRYPDGKPIPRGEYTVYIMDADGQPPEVAKVLATIPASPEKLPALYPKDRKLVSQKSYFLGGAKDTIYQTRLKEFHDKLRERAKTELDEIKQFESVLESQFFLTAQNYNKFHNSKGRLSRPAQKGWGDFNGKWSQLEGQLNGSFRKWTPDALQNEYFYGSLYTMVQQLGQSIERAHSLHNAYFVGRIDPKAFEIQLGEASASAQNALQALKAKIAQADALAPTPNGMPRRDGL